MSKILYRALLPSGRGVRFKRLSTRDYLSLQQRVAAKVGDKKDPGGGLVRTMVPVETVAMSIVAITLDPLPWKHTQPDAVGDVGDSVIDTLSSAPSPVRPSVDVDAMLDDADARKLWTTVTYADVMRREGPLSFDELFDELADFTAMVSLATGEGREDPSKGQNLLGKVQVVSGG